MPASTGKPPSNIIQAVTRIIGSRQGVLLISTVPAAQHQEAASMHKRPTGEAPRRPRSGETSTRSPTRPRESPTPWRQSGRSPKSQTARMADQSGMV